MGFFTTTTGRLLALSVAIAFIVGAASALFPAGSAEGSFLLCSSLFVPLVLNVVGLPQALEKNWQQAVISIALAPQLFFLWAVGVGAIREHHHNLAVPFMLLGLVPLAVALRPAPGSIVVHRPVAQH
jgi:hypothetical protein